jgi:hypothetical protein
MKPIMDFVYQVLSTPLALQHLHFYHEELFAKDPQTEQNERAWGEFWTSKTYKVMCDEAPVNIESSQRAKVFPFFLEHDKTPLSRNGMLSSFSSLFLLFSFVVIGIHVAWPLIATVANVPLHLQGNPLFRDVIAYFPTLPKEYINTKSHASFCHNLLWHHCMKIVLSSLANLPLSGTCFLLPFLVFHKLSLLL